MLRQQMSKRALAKDNGLLLLVVALWLCLFLSGLWTRDLWNPDETRYAEVAQEMLLSGDYILPHLNGQPYPDKPPLFFWLVVLLSKLLGADSELPTRLVASMAGLGTVLLVFFWSAFAFPDNERIGGLLSGLVLATNAQFLTLSQIGSMDTTLTFLTTSALFCFYRGYHITHGKQWWYLGFYFLSGLAVLTKGPVGIIIPGLVAICYTLYREGWRGLQASHPIWGLSMVMTMVGLWLIPAAWRGGAEYMQKMLLHHVAGRIVHSFAHALPIYYYLLEFPLAFLPWTFFLIPALIKACAEGWSKERQKRSSENWFFHIWLVAVFLFLSLVSGKRGGYMLPLYPAAAMIVSRFFMDHFTSYETKLTRAFTIPFYLNAIVFIIAGLFGLFLYLKGHELANWLSTHGMIENRDIQEGMKKVLSQLHGTILAGSILIGIWGQLALWLTWRGRFKVSLVSVALPMMAGIVYFNLWVAPLLNEYKSPKPFAKMVLASIDASERLAFYHSDYNGRINFYLGIIHIPVFKQIKQVEKFISSDQKVYIITRKKHWDKLKKLLGLPLYLVMQDYEGQRAMVLLSNQPGNSQKH